VIGGEAMHLQPLSEHQVLVFWSQLLVILAVAHALMGLLRRLDQPPVIGALLAGFLLSGSALGALWPEGWSWLFPPDPRQEGLLVGISWIGVALLLIVTGLETDVALVRRLGRAAACVSIGALALPLATGLTLGLVLPEAFLASEGSRGLFSLFLATALSISALPVIAKILSELDLMRRNVGQVTLAAASVGDLVGWVLLGTVSGVAHAGSFAWGDLALRLASVGIFLLVAFTAGQRVVDAALRLSRARGAGATGALGVAVLAAVGTGLASHLIGLEAFFGAFVAGILLGRSRFHESEVFGRVETITSALFAPLFFATAGLRADLSRLADPVVLSWGAIVLLAASLSKFAGAYFGARFAGMHPREGFALGSALNARGAIELVIATVGLSLGVLNPASYTVVVLLALVTSAMAPPLLRAVLRHWPGSEEEQERLARERLHGESLLVRPVPILLPSHGGPNSQLAARLIDLAWPEGTKVTVLSVGPSVPAQDVARVLAVFQQKPVEHHQARDRDARATVLEQAKLGYGTLVVGATDRRVEGRLVSPFVDDLIATSSIPVVMVRRGAARDVPEAAARFRRILVPAIGTLPGRAAQEVAFGLARRLGAQVLLAHVITAPVPAQEFAYSRHYWVRERQGDGRSRPEFSEPGRVAERVVQEARALAEEMGVATETAICLGASAPAELLSLVQEAAIDLVVLPANLRQLSERPFLGYGVEYLLDQCESTVVVVSVPPGWRRP
jgi:Kef-type K+ transport system membrane component KefB